MVTPSSAKAPSPATSTVPSLFTASAGTHRAFSDRSTMMWADTFMPGFRSPYSDRRMVTG